MADDEAQEPTEQTPKGLDVPIPKRRDFFGNLKKAAKPGPTPGSSEAGSRMGRESDDAPAA